MDADLLMRLWAAKRLGLDPSDVLSVVEFEHEDEYRYSSWTIEPAYDYAAVSTTAGERRISTTNESVADILREMVACAP